MTIEKYVEKLISKFGDNGQIIVAIEELSELQKELCKALRYGGDRAAMLEEIADVQLMLDKIKCLFGYTDDQIKTHMQSKMIRTIERYELS